MRFPDDKDKDKENQENINGAECERKQGNDEGRHCKNDVMAETCYNRAETRRNSYSDPCSNAIYSQFSAWTYTILGIIRKGTSVRSVLNHCHLPTTYCTHQTRYYVKHSKFIIFGDNLAQRALQFTKLNRQLSRIWIHVSAKFHWYRYKDRRFRASWSYFSIFLKMANLEGNFLKFGQW